MDVTFFASSGEFRHWLEQHHDQAKELWVGFYKKASGKPTISYKEALDQALCFGWIDGNGKSIDDISYTTRFTPRKPHSRWSAINLKRVEELTEAGLMHPAGLKAHQERDITKQNLYANEQEHVELPEGYTAQFRTQPEAWNYFQSTTAAYQKRAIWWVISAKREETRLKRLQTLIDESAQGRRIASV